MTSKIDPLFIVIGIMKGEKMTKLWLTDKSYPIWSYLLRIAYWLFAIYLSSLFLQVFQQESWFKFALIALSILFVIIFLIFTRFIDRFLKVSIKD